MVIIRRRDAHEASEQNEFHARAPGQAEIGLVRALVGTFSLGYKSLALLNGIGVGLVLVYAIQLVSLDVAPYFLRAPLTAFVAGLAFAGLGLMWSQVLHSSLLTQLRTQRPRRSHWVPMFCAWLSYFFSLLVFAAGCWFVMGIANFAYTHG